MGPKAHLLISAGMSGGIVVAGGSPELAAGAFVGGFLIDLDHYLDFVAFGGQKSFGPSKFLSFYQRHEYDRVVLALHSYELMAALGLFCFLVPHPLILGYLMGAAFHMALDIGFNRPMIQSPISFYSLLYRARRGFAKDRLLHLHKLEEAAQRYAPAASPVGSD